LKACGGRAASPAVYRNFTVLLHKKYTGPPERAAIGKIVADIHALLELSLLARFLHILRKPKKRRCWEKKLDKPRVRMI
jgi:hypothetical protein